MIVLFTDFGWHGPYVGQIKAVLNDKVPNMPVIDLMHDAPAFDTVAASHLLAAFAPQFPPDTIFMLFPYRKTEQEDLTPDQVKLLRKMVKEFLS